MLLSIKTTGQCDSDTETKMTKIWPKVFIMHSMHSYHRQTDTQTDITTGLHTASFAYIYTVSSKNGAAKLWLYFGWSSYGLQDLGYCPAACTNLEFTMSMNGNSACWTFGMILNRASLTVQLTSGVCDLKLASGPEEHILWHCQQVVKLMFLLMLNLNLVGFFIVFSA